MKNINCIFRKDGVHIYICMFELRDLEIEPVPYLLWKGKNTLKDGRWDWKAGKSWIAQISVIILEILWKDEYFPAA